MRGRAVRVINQGLVDHIWLVTFAPSHSLMNNDYW